MFELFDPDAEYTVRRTRQLPHWYQPRASYFVTFRTKDSIPADVARRYHSERNEWLERMGVSAGGNAIDELPLEVRRAYHCRFSKKYMDALDQGMGACVLARPELRAMVTESLHHFDGVRYHLGDYVVMPNHVHAIVGLLGSVRIDAVCSSWKRSAARRINAALGQKGRFWQEESFDHLIRTPKQFRAIQQYIAENPRNLHPDQYTLYRCALVE